MIRNFMINLKERPEILFPLFGDLKRFSKIGPKVEKNFKNAGFNHPIDLLFLLLILLIITFLLHYAFVMILIGTPVIALIETVIKRKDKSLAWEFLRSKYPVCISLAITTGIAPFLFAQVTFNERFYITTFVLYII